MNPLSSQCGGHTDPFTDAAALSEGDHDNILESTLPVGDDASLTLSADGVIVTDDGFNDSEPRLCGFFPTTHAKTIPFFHILNAQLLNNTISIHYVRPKRPKANSKVRLRTLIYPVSASADAAERWIARLLDGAYGIAQRSKRIKVLINPFAGATRSQVIYNKQIAPLFEAAGCQVDVEPTKYRGHAVEVARDIDVEAYDVLACASGDGLPMECFNGLGHKRNAMEALRKIAVVQLPCGTGNAMSWNLNGTDEPSLAALCIIKGIRTPIDLASVTQGNKRTLSFLSQSLGIVAESDLGTENIRWMGDFRFTFGFLVRLLGKTLYPIEYAVKTEIESKDDIKKHYACELSHLKHATETLPSSHMNKELEAQSGSGLPPLRFGTINDPLPPKDENSGWTRLESYPNLGNFYCGNMCWMAADAPFFPASLPNDGMLDLVTIDGDVSRLKAFKLMLAVGNGTFFDDEIVRIRKISAVRVIPRFGRPMEEISSHSLQDQATTTSSSNDNNNDTTTISPTSTAPKPPTGLLQRLFAKVASSGKTGFFSVDGEQLPWQPFQVEIHRGLGTVLSRTPGVYQYEGPRGWRDVEQQQNIQQEQGEGAVGQMGSVTS
ncbi:sphinganine kinase lcb4 [Lithohypha guttulata]|uniref:sphinganine kinase lcb4 n=1 Tax=Lithohypha guttulata TaxID=1690604 RepID=UPI002DDFEA38|nr:sphinganine kinase lcb4 [Lithohypha guttulata]